jgi:hypothetical protein
MNRGTIMMVAIALGAAAGAWSMRPQELPPAQFEDTGEPLFGDFTDPASATALTVVSWDEDQAKVERFAVEQKAGLWVIPSHNDYPADGTERMGKAAASFIDVKKDVYYGDKPEDHARFGVLDPEGSDGKGDEKGQRITIKDASGTVLVDVIVGKAPEGKQGFYYVRKPEEKRVYGAKLTLDVSTDFGDWIEKDLLHVERDEIVQVAYDPYSVDESAGKVMGSNPVVAELKMGGDGKEAWTAIEPTLSPEGQTLDSAKVKQVVTAAANVKIVGVRPRPEVLTLQALQSKGFFVTPDGRQLFGNEGQASLITKDGLVYSLYFGEITFDSGRALTAGSPDEGATPEDGDTEGKTANRYMFVDVRYDATLDSAAVKPPEEPPAEGEEAAPPTIDEAAAQAGAERAAKLGKRFSKWFYVISDSSFKQIHKDRGELFKALPPPEPQG